MSGSLQCFRFSWSRSPSPSANAKYGADEKEDEEDQEQGFGDPGSGDGNSTKAEDPGDQGNDEKDESVVQHGQTPLIRGEGESDPGP